jgi:hypothetical protein
MEGEMNSSYDFNYNEENLNRLRSWISLTQGGAAREDGNEGKAGGDGKGATEMEALRAFAEGVGMPIEKTWDGVMMLGDGVEIVEIDWSRKNLQGTLPVGDMHMPYLRKLNLGGNNELEGEGR